LALCVAVIATFPQAALDSCNESRAQTELINTNQLFFYAPINYSSAQFEAVWSLGSDSLETLLRDERQ